jgi:hypothetical protein
VIDKSVQKWAFKWEGFTKTAGIEGFSILHLCEWSKCDWARLKQWLNLGVADGENAQRPNHLNLIVPVNFNMRKFEYLVQRREEFSFGNETAIVWKCRKVEGWCWILKRKKETILVFRNMNGKMSFNSIKRAYCFVNMWT